MARNYCLCVSPRHAVRALTVSLSLLAACGVSALAQEEMLSPEASSTSPPYAEFQYATLTGTNNTLNLTLLPVVNAEGVTTLKNVTLHFTVDSKGDVALSSLQQALAPPPVVNGFKAGTYCGPNGWNPNMVITVTGPGLTSGGATEWTIAATPKSFYNTYPNSATWYVGTIANNPVYQRIQAAGIKFNGWSYGFGGGPYGGEGADWEPNSLLGLSQVGDTLTIQSFTENGKDHNQPVNQVTYTACSGSTN